MSSIIGPLPFTFVNGETADGSQVNANLAAIVTGVNNNAAQKGNGQVLQIVMVGLTSDTNFTLPANSMITGVAVQCTSGSLTSGAAVYLSNSLNTYPNVKYDLISLSSLSAGQGITGVRDTFASIINHISGSDLTTQFDLSDGMTPGNGFNGATVNAIIQFVTF